MKSIGSCQSPCNAAVGEERGGLALQQVVLFPVLYRLTPFPLLDTRVPIHRRCLATRPAVDPRRTFVFERRARPVLASDSPDGDRKNATIPLSAI